VESLAVLGVTGSIGRQTLAVADQLEMTVTGIAARRPSDELLEIAKRYPAADVAVADNGKARDGFVEQLGSRLVGFGPEALIAMASHPGQIVMNAIVGVAGLPVTLAAAEAGNRLALANKESMVVAGVLVREAVARGGGELIPVDSEHSAIFQCLVGEPPPAKIVLTASGGPFRGMKRPALAEVTPQQALRHPNWDMGQRVTIDSATLANKALEVLEASALFELGLDQVEVVIHPESAIHSLVVFSDGSMKAQLGPADMRLPIAYAFTYPNRAKSIVSELTLAGASFHFEEPDLETFPTLALGYAAGRAGGTSPAVFNAADEVAVDAFLNGQLDFLGIAQVIEHTLGEVENQPVTSLADVQLADQQARRIASTCIGNLLR